MATATSGTRKRPQPSRSPIADPCPVAGRAQGVGAAVEGDGGQDAHGDQHHAPEVGGVTGHDRPHGGQDAGRLAAGPAGRSSRLPDHPDGRAPPPHLEDLERDRADDADLPLDRDAPDRPAGRLVAVVTVGNRVLPQGHHHGDTQVGRSDGDDHRDDHRALAGAVAHQPGPAPCGPPG